MKYLAGQISFHSKSSNRNTIYGKNDFAEILKSSINTVKYSST